ncbi:hypothetical protein Cme02nite_51160 [Catellatospora methionotrophica]|uniref:Uncharacterized protein n=1 Tax=Catellatospora methionotrophica TaxID=121620 RepID=A0A8J3LDU8_9ACTN|nr:hypothetical protein Cme02nite_51160 [Catellatospora methionotrophica]
MSVENVSVVFCYFLDMLLTAYPDAKLIADFMRVDITCSNPFHDPQNRRNVDRPGLAFLGGKGLLCR